MCVCVYVWLEDIRGHVCFLHLLCHISFHLSLSPFVLLSNSLYCLFFKAQGLNLGKYTYVNIIMMIIVFFFHFFGSKSRVSLS